MNYYLKKKKNVNFLYYITIVIFLIITLGPLVWALIVSITPEFEMFKNTPNFLPKKPTFDNYIKLFTSSERQSKMFLNGTYNSLKTAVITIIFCVPISVLCAYPISRMKFKGKKIIRGIILVTMAIPIFTTIIPLYRMFSIFKLLDNFYSLSLVYVTSFLPINTWLISNYFDTIPSELEDAAYIDGCSKLSALFKIILPISYPILFSSALLIFLMTWSQFQIPLILASSNATKPISIVASEFVVKDSIQYGITTAAGILAILPPAIIAVIFRKFLIGAMTGGSTKG